MVGVNTVVGGKHLSMCGGSKRATRGQQMDWPNQAREEK